MTDIEIAQNNKMIPVADVAAKIGITADKLENYGPYKAKITFDELRALQEKAASKPGKLILVTAVTPTPAGEGKSTVSIGLADGLNKIGKKTVVALREPSLGPCFGVKGGACGGGYAQIVPMEKQKKKKRILGTYAHLGPFTEMDDGKITLEEFFGVNSLEEVKPLI